MWYQYQVEYAPAVLAQIPGVAVRANGMLHVPDNARTIVERVLTGHDVRFSSRCGSKTLEPDLALTKSRLRPWVLSACTEYQREGILRALELGDISLWHSTGSGKTWCGTVWACAYPGKFVVVTKSGVRRQWKNEIERLTVLKVQILEGEKDPTEIDLSSDVWIVGHDTLPTYAEKLKGLYTAVVFDEIHKIKSHKRWSASIDPETEKTKFSLNDNIAAAAMILSKNAKRRIALTATALSNRTRDLWAQLDLVSPGHWGTFVEFTTRYCARHTNEWNAVDTSGSSNEAELVERIKAVVHRVPFSRANRSLPPKRRLVTRVAVADQVRSSAIKDEMRAAGRLLGSSRTRAILELKLMEAASRKRKMALELIRDAIEGEQKVLVLTGRRKDCEALAEEVKKLGCPTWWGHGGTPEAQRETMKTEYMETQGPCVLVGTIDAWGESYNLQDTDLLLCVMLPYTPRQIIQLEGRVVRLGQKRPVLIQYLIAELTADERVASILLSKLPQVEKIVGNGEVDALPEVLRGGTDEELVQSLAHGLLSDD